MGNSTADRRNRTESSQKGRTPQASTIAEERTVKNQSAGAMRVTRPIRKSDADLFSADIRMTKPDMTKNICTPTQPTLAQAVDSGNATGSPTTARMPCDPSDSAQDKNVR